MINDYNILSEIFSSEELKSYSKIRSWQQNLGKSLENYITENLEDGMFFVGRNAHRPVGVDYIIHGELWSIKNAYNTANSSSLTFLRDRNINHWYRLNKNGTTNWDSLPVNGVSELGFIDYLCGKTKITLDDFA